MRTLAIALCLLATPALADVAGTASVIDSDTIKVHGQQDTPARDRRAREPATLPPGRRAMAVRERCGEHPNRSTYQLMSAITVLSHGPWFARRLVRAGFQ